MLRWEQCCDEIKKLETEEAEKNEEYKKLNDVSELYADLYSRKEKYLLQQPGTSLLSSSERLAGVNSQFNEVREAKEVGEALIGHLKLVYSHLKSSSNWGTWDMFGGGFLVTMAKRSSMDKAKEAMQDAQHLLHSFNKELGDISKEQYNFRFEGGLTSFADYFFDGLIVDWLVQSSINKAFNITQELFTKVEDTCMDLEARMDKLTLAKSEIVEGIRNIVESF